MAFVAVLLLALLTAQFAFSLKSKQALVQPAMNGLSKRQVGYFDLNRYDWTPSENSDELDVNKWDNEVNRDDDYPSYFESKRTATHWRDGCHVCQVDNAGDCSVVSAEHHRHIECKFHTHFIENARGEAVHHDFCEAFVKRNSGKCHPKNTD